MYQRRIKKKNVYFIKLSEFGSGGKPCRIRDEGRAKNALCLI
jgi:hypothetical protein